jgi:hypothetical protein
VQNLSFDAGEDLVIGHRHWNFEGIRTDRPAAQVPRHAAVEIGPTPAMATAVDKEAAAADTAAGHVG